MNNAFVDTDVILDFLTGREPFARHAAQLFSLAEKKELSVCTSGLVFSNAYYVLRRLATHKKVMEKLRAMARLVKVVDLSKSAVLQALDSPFDDFEDALQYFAAAGASVSLIITRNIRDYRQSELAVLTPEQYLKALAS